MSLLQGAYLGEYILREIWNKADSRTTIKEAGRDRNLLNSIHDCCDMFFCSAKVPVSMYICTFCSRFRCFYQEPITVENTTMTKDARWDRHSLHSLACAGRELRGLGCFQRLGKYCDFGATEYIGWRIWNRSRQKDNDKGSLR